MSQSPFSRLRRGGSLCLLAGPNSSDTCAIHRSMLGNGVNPPGGLKAISIVVHALRAGGRNVFRVPPVVLAIALALAAGFAAFSVNSSVGVLGLTPSGTVGVLAVAALGYWGWTVRPAMRGQFVIFVSEFAEQTTHAHVKTATVHRRELLEKLRTQLVFAEGLQIRTLPPLSLSIAERVLRRSPGSAVVLGETVAAGEHVKWTAAMVYRLHAHSRYAAETEEGEPAIRLGREAWTALKQLRLPVDARQSIAILTEADFPASHAEGITAMVQALYATRIGDVSELEAAIAATRSRWQHAPSVSKALTVAAEADIAMITKGWDASRRVLRSGVKDVHDPLLRRLYAGSLALGSAHGVADAREWLRAAEPLPEMTNRDPGAMFILACAQMGCGRWRDALDTLRLLRTVQFHGPLAPHPSEVLSAYAQAADLANERDELALALQLLRKAFPRRRLRRPPRQYVPMYLLAWMQGHNYDGVALPRMQQRLNELGRDLAIADIRRPPGD
jgi:hypothetical protein